MIQNTGNSFSDFSAWTTSESEVRLDPQLRIFFGVFENLEGGFFNLKPQGNHISNLHIVNNIHKEADSTSQDQILSPPPHTKLFDLPSLFAA